MGDPIERRPAVLLHTDCVGASVLMADDDIGTVRIIARNRTVVVNAVEKHGGRVLDAVGDIALAEMPNVTDAVRCGIEIQREIGRQNSELPPERKLPLRLAIHLTEVIAEGDRLHGSGISVVTRLISLARPGGLCLSEAAFVQVQGRHEGEVEDLGPRRLRNLPNMVRAYRVSTGAEEVSQRPEERRLAAIMQADVVSYSRMMVVEETATIEQVTRYLNGMTARVEEHRGRVIDTAGDGVLAEFPSALDATRCGIEIQRFLDASGTDISEDARLEYRIGIHLGDVRSAGDRIYGSGINVAARLEALAPPGGLCISSPVYEQVRHHLDLEFEDLGEQALKNIPERIRAYRAWPGGAPPVNPSSRRRWIVLGGIGALLAASALVAWLLL